MIPKFDIRSMLQKNFGYPFNWKTSFINNFSFHSLDGKSIPQEQYYKCEFILPVEYWAHAQGDGPDFGFIAKSQVKENGDIFVRYVFRESDLPNELKPFLYEEDTIFDQLDQYVVIFHPKICLHIKQKFLDTYG